MTTLAIPGQSVVVPASTVTGPTQTITLPPPSIADSTATLVAAGYTVTPPAVTPPVPPSGTAPKLLVVLAQNGATPNLPQDYSYEATDVRSDKTIGGNGNPMCIKVTTTGPWGGFQPSCNNGATLDFSSCTTLIADVSAAAGQQFSMQFLMGGDLPIVDANGDQVFALFTKTKAGYERFTVPALQLMTDAKKGDVRKSIYKGAVQSKSTTDIVYAVDNWGGL